MFIIPMPPPGCPGYPWLGNGLEVSATQALKIGRPARPISAFWRNIRGCLRGHLSGNPRHHAFFPSRGFMSLTFHVFAHVFAITTNGTIDQVADNSVSTCAPENIADFGEPLCFHL